MSRIMKLCNVACMYFIKMNATVMSMYSTSLYTYTRMYQVVRFFYF